MNTKITYLYRDADNYHQVHQVIVSGEITDELKDEILDNRYEDESFVPDYFMDWPWGIDGYEPNDETDHPMCEIDEDDFELTDEEPTVPQSIETVAAMFRDCANIGWLSTEGYESRMSEIMGF